MKNNYCIIMAGGIGSRFWPFSRNEKPKQFLDFFGTGRTLLQMTYDRILPLVPKENIFIVSNYQYRDLILEQLQDITPNQILLEPMRRNTAPCIAYAVYKIHQLNDKANILTVPSDHLITKEDEFRRVVGEGFRFISFNDALLTLGMRPTRPETGYGYIQLGKGGGELRKVKTFTEKPNLEMAQVFLNSGEFYWNSGMFLWRSEVIIKAFEELLPEISNAFASGLGIYHTKNEQNFINNIYPLCPNISIDYGIMEKAQNVFVMLADFGWSDLGTWSSLHELSPKDEANNVSLNCNVQFYDGKNNIVVAEPGKLVIVDGLNDYLVAEDNNVLLICRKNDEQKMRQFVKDADTNYEGRYN